MLSFPNAKINIGLQILRRRNDGFHDIASCFYPVDWCDIIEILPAKKNTFVASGLKIEGKPESNLCMRAYQLLKDDFEIEPVRIQLHKIIPMGAGMGGGSSDGAFVLKLLNELFKLNLSAEQLKNYARKLGSDCAFFIENKPMLCLEKGDVFQEINLDLSKKNLVLINPNVHISTTEAYAGVKPTEPKTSLEEMLKNPISMWKNEVKNDFEGSLFVKYPKLLQIKQKLYDLGAEYASMTGSGSTLYGIFSEQSEQMQISRIFDDCTVWQTK